MTPAIEIINEKKLVGKRMIMSYSDYRIGELWRSFIPRRKEIKNNLTNELISLVIFKPGHFEHLKPTNQFERWAAVEVENFDNVPSEMETFILPESLYAVFHYQGSGSDISNFYQHIFNNWLPDSGYQLDDRPHFEVLGEKYKNNDPASEEDIWIPIKTKSPETSTTPAQT